MKKLIPYVVVGFVAGCVILATAVTIFTVMPDDMTLSEYEEKGVDLDVDWVNKGLATE